MFRVVDVETPRTADLLLGIVGWGHRLISCSRMIPKLTKSVYIGLYDYVIPNSYRAGEKRPIALDWE